MRRTPIALLTALLVSAVLPVSSHADTGATVIDSDLPDGWTGTGTTFVVGPDGVGSGTGSLEFQGLSSTNLVPITSYTHLDSTIHVPAGTSAILTLAWTCCGTGDVYELKVPMTTTPGWNHFQLLDSTPVQFYAGGSFQYADSWAYFKNFPNGTITGTTIQLAGSGPAHVDTLTTGNGTSFDFEPLAPPTISSSATTVTYGHSVLITGTVVDAYEARVAQVQATLWHQRTGDADFTEVDEDASSRSGVLAAEVAPTSTATYRWTGPSGVPGAERTIKVAPAVTARVPSKTQARRKLTVKGSVTPLFPGLSIQLLRSGSKKPIGMSSIGNDGSYAVTGKLPRGRWRVWTRTAPTTGYVAGESSKALVTAR